LLMRHANYLCKDYNLESVFTQPPGVIRIAVSDETIL
jgi:hypothetical protein